LLAVFIEGSCLSGIIDAQVISMVTCEWEWGYKTLLSFFCCMTELSPFPPMWRTHGDHLHVLIFRELGKGIIVVSWLWGCQCNFGGWHASNVCNCAMLANQSLRAEAENGPKHFLLSAELMSLLAVPDTLGYESFVRRCEGSRHRQTRELGEGE
jgi:hypothetical protein